MKSNVNISELVAAYMAEANDRIAAKVEREQQETDRIAAMREKVGKASDELRDDLLAVYKELIALGLTAITKRPSWDILNPRDTSALFTVTNDAHMDVNIYTWMDGTSVLYTSSCYGDRPLYHATTKQPAEIVVKHAAYAGEQLALHHAGKPKYFLK